MATTPEERVTAFLTDYTRRHAAAAGTFDPPNPEAWENWRRACREVSREHGTDKFLVTSDSYQGASPFDPATTRFTEVAVRGQYATVSAVREAAYRFVEFKLRRIDDDWRMNDVKEYLKDPGSRASSGAVERALAGATTKTPPPLTSDDPKNPGDLFESGIQVRPVGEFEHGEVLCLQDFFYLSTDEAKVLDLRVAAGRARVEVAIHEGDCAALRVLLTASPVVQWALAETNGSHIVGVDSGSVGVADAATLLSLNEVSREAITDAYASDDRDAVIITSPRKTDFGVLCRSGWGDGGYPAFWGLDAQGRPAQLVVDFEVIPRRVGRLQRFLRFSRART